MWRRQSGNEISNMYIHMFGSTCCAFGESLRYEHRSTYPCYRAIHSKTRNSVKYNQRQWQKFHFRKPDAAQDNREGGTQKSGCNIRLRKYADQMDIPAYAPSMGGFYERLIGTTKQAIAKTLAMCKLNSDQYTTVLVEIESTINSRPPAYVILDDMTILTPNHSLSDNPIIAIPIDDDGDPEYEPTISNKEQITAAWRKENHLLRQFWKMWSNQHILSLRERSQRKLTGTVTSGTTTQAGGVVIFKPKTQ
jgi:hypothetical protein